MNHFIYQNAKLKMTKSYGLIIQLIIQIQIYFYSCLDQGLSFRSYNFTTMKFFIKQTNNVNEDHYHTSYHLGSLLCTLECSVEGCRGALTPNNRPNCIQPLVC